MASKTSNLRPDMSGHRLPAHPRPSYWERSRRPLTILVFLLPLIVAYELGVVLLRGELSNVAHLTLLRFFEAFGIPALGGIAIVVILLVWHVMAGYRWRIRWGVIGLMAVESAALAIPLVVINHVIGSLALSAAVTVGETADGHMWLKMLIVSSVGAGLYEELLFRMLLIGALHTLMVDVAGASNRMGCVIAIVVSAFAFGWYHTIGQTDPVQVRAMVFWVMAGLYFGAIFLARGFGIVVAVHALHNMIVFITQ